MCERRFISAATGEPVTFGQYASEDGAEQYSVAVVGGNDALAFQLMDSGEIVLLVRPGREQEDFAQLHAQIERNDRQPLPFRRADAPGEDYFTIGRIGNMKTAVCFLAVIGEETTHRIEKMVQSADTEAEGGTPDA